MYPPSTIYTYPDMPSTQRIRTHNLHRQKHHPTPTDPGPSLYTLPTYVTHTTANHTQTHVQHSRVPIGLVRHKPTLLIPRTTLIHSTSHALDTIHKPRVPLQRLLNAAARIITNLRKYDQITEAMKKLHWVPIESRIQYKVLVLVHACVHNISPPYLSSLFTSYIPSREMRSSGKLILHQPIPNMVTYGKRSFAYGGPRL